MLKHKKLQFTELRNMIYTVKIFAPFEKCNLYKNDQQYQKLATSDTSIFSNAF